MYSTDWKDLGKKELNQGADKDVGSGEDPEVLQEVPQKEISAEGVKKEGFHFDDYFGDYFNLDMKRMHGVGDEFHDGDRVLKNQRADTKERWKKHIEGDDYVPSPPSASSINRAGNALPS